MQSLLSSTLVMVLGTGSAWIDPGVLATASTRGDLLGPEASASPETPVQDPAPADAAQPEATTPAPAPTAAAPAAEPSPAAPTPALEPSATAPATDAPPPSIAPQSAQPPPESPPLPGPAPSADPLGETQTGLGLLIAGPLLVVAGIPFSLAGNIAWRKSCGPTTSTRRCARGTAMSLLTHTMAGLAYGGGIGMVAAGGARRGRYDAARHARLGGGSSRTGFIIAGAVTLPTFLVGMGVARLFLWLPTPECQTHRCVQEYQLSSTLAVSAMALGAAAGAGMLSYGLSYNKWQRRHRLSVSPAVSKGFAGLQMGGEF